MSPHPSEPRYLLTFHPQVADDLTEIARYGAPVLEVVATVFDDLAHGRLTGRQLGARRFSGDLTGYARVKFDLPDQRPPRFRLLYRTIDSTTRDVLAVGPRDQHAIYQAAVRRLASQPGTP